MHAMSESQQTSGTDAEAQTPSPGEPSPQRPETEAPNEGTAPAEGADEQPAPPADAQQVENAGNTEKAEKTKKPSYAEPPADLAARVEAALLTSDRALPAAKLAEALGGLAPQAITDAIATLNGDYEKTGRSFRIEQVAGGWKVMTLPEYGDVLEALHKKRSESKLSPAALETLAIIAYKQPVLRAEIEAIRGAASGEVIRSLMERHLIKIVGRAEEIGRPMLYGTTKTFLEVFGLSSLKDLPQVEQLKSGKT